ncbi:hypothetical protein KAU11_00290 [Candidatus Babeliales bacterium]|nr:hypothetical protein [Candidatus Babeliales bacterium]
MEEGSALIATNIIIMEAGIMTLRSKKVEEPTMTFNLSLNIRPSVLAVITERLDRWLPDQLEEKEKQARLTKGISLFLSDMIDSGIVLSAHEIAKEVKTQP